MLKHHVDRPPGALARGATKTSDIERVRGEVGQAEQRVARRFQAAIARYGERASTRAEARHVRFAATAGPCSRPVSGAAALPALPTEPSSPTARQAPSSPPRAS